MENMNLYTWKTEAAAKSGFQYAKEGKEEAVKALIDVSFNIGDCDSRGNSLLHYAVQGKNLNLIRYLVERCGLDPAWANENLTTPFDLAHDRALEDSSFAEIENYFETHCGFSHKDCYRNPVCRGMHADPSIVRVGEDYYMVHSSFIYFPCIPISHSKDLIHWEVIGHAVTDSLWAREHLGPLEGGRGFWAPDISFHNGRFYICATLRNNDDAEFIQTQMVTGSEKPEGPYDTPVIHKVPGIDPSIFTDDDGRRYMLLNRGARIMEISQDGREILTKPSLIWYGHSGLAPEGPHLLKKDGFYYCFLAEGGTGKGHMITVARSRHLMGPYEDCPYNPIMTQRDSIAAIQCCGHGKPVQTQDGRWFMVYLCSRLFDGKWGFLGRETCLDEITWTKDGWPLVNSGKGPSYMAVLPHNKKASTKQSPCPEPEKEPKKEPEKEPENKQENKQENNPKSESGIWYSPRTIDSNFITIEEDGALTILGDGRDLCSRDCRSIMLKPQPEFQFYTEFEMEVQKKDDKTSFTSDAGITLYYDENTYIKFGVNRDSVFVTEFLDDTYVRTESFPNSPAVSMIFGIKTCGLTREFYFNGNLICRWSDVTSICSEGLVKGKRFTGAMYGVYVNGTDLLRWRQPYSDFFPDRVPCQENQGLEVSQDRQKNHKRIK